METKKTGEKFKERRERLGIQVNYILDKLEKKGINISNATYSRYENGITKTIPIHIVKAIGEILNINPTYLLGLEEEKTMISKIMEYGSGIKRGVWINVYRSIVYGKFIEDIKDIQGQVLIPEEWTFKNKEYLALLVKGDSMFPQYDNCDIAVIRKQGYFDDGDDCAIYVNGSNAIIRKTSEIKKDQVKLVTVNPCLPPEIYKKEQVKVLGKVVEIRRNKDS